MSDELWVFGIGFLTCNVFGQSFACLAVLCDFALSIGSAITVMHEPPTRSIHKPARDPRLLGRIEPRATDKPRRNLRGSFR